MSIPPNPTEDSRTPEPELQFKLSNSYYRSSGLFYLHGVWWKSVIHYFYAQKFRGDAQIQDVIQLYDDPKDLIVKLSKRSLPYSKNVIWSKIKYAIIKRAMYTKFEQNIELYKLLTEAHDQLDKINDNVTDQSSVVWFEIAPNTILKQIQNYYSYKGHPMIDTPKGNWKPHIQKLVDEYNGYSGWTFPQTKIRKKQQMSPAQYND